MIEDDNSYHDIPNLEIQLKITTRQKLGKSSIKECTIFLYDSYNRASSRIECVLLKPLIQKTKRVV